MATQRPAFSADLAEFARALLSERELVPRARITAQFVREIIPGSSVLVYAVEKPEEPVWVVKWAEGEVSPQEHEVAYDSGTLGALLETTDALLFDPAELARETYAHLNVRRTLKSMAAVPIRMGESLLGAIEVVSCDEPISEEQLGIVAELAETVAIGFSASNEYEFERNASLHSITRLTQLYDIEKVFNSTLEFDNLLPIICTKVQELLNAQGVNLWLIAGESIQLMHQGGVDPTVHEGATQGPNDGVAGAMAESGEAVVIDSETDERLQKRNEVLGGEEGGVFSLIAAPMVQDGSLVGVIEVVNRVTGIPFDEDDLFMLTQTADVAANALHNASLLQAERKVEILQTLVTVSQEITSTLHMDRVMEAIVNGPQAVIPYERASLGLEEHGKFRLTAISGMSQIIPTDPDTKRVDTLLRWASSLNQEIFVQQFEEIIEADREETKEKFAKYFEETGMRAFYALPLGDEEGRVGILAYESSDAEFLSEAHIEMIKVLAGQATVALRNASLYKEVPFIGVIEPLIQRKERFMRMEKHRRMTYIAMAAAICLFLVAFPWPMRVDGDAEVAPGRTAHVAPVNDGVVTQVLVREGQRIQQGSLLAQMDDADQRSALAAAQAKYNAAIAEMNRALAANDGAVAGQKRIEADYWQGEVGRAQSRLADTQLRSPINGVVATPHVENLAGRKLGAGEAAVEVLNTDSAVVDVAIAEKEVALLKPGASASVKLEGFPTKTFRGKVAVISPKSDADKEHRFFYARVEIPNANGDIRAGMQGRGKVSVGWRPAGYALFRGLGTWFWSKLWGWFGW